MRDTNVVDSFIDQGVTPEDFQAHVVEGLSKPRKALSCKYLYDARGSALFEEITRLPEYYPTRTELAILDRAVPELAGWIDPGATLVEYGSGSSTKVRRVLDALRAPASYIPVDISRDHLIGAAEGLARDYPGLSVTPVCADYTRTFELPAAEGPRLGFFPGSTIGNFAPESALRFLRGVAAELGTGAFFLVGVDLQKDRRVLEAAYNDRHGVTAAFNLNLLERMNREAGGEFRPEAFRHHAPYNQRLGRIEMHIVSREDQDVAVAGRRFAFAADETIHTENSYKYTLEGFARMADKAGFETARFWCDGSALFSIHLLRVREVRMVRPAMPASAKKDVAPRLARFS